MIEWHLAPGRSGQQAGSEPCLMPVTGCHAMKLQKNMHWCRDQEQHEHRSTHAELQLGISVIFKPVQNAWLNKHPLNIHPFPDMHLEGRPTKWTSTLSWTQNRMDGAPPDRNPEGSPHPGAASLFLRPKLMMSSSTAAENAEGNLQWPAVKVSLPLGRWGEIFPLSSAHSDECVLVWNWGPVSWSLWLNLELDLKKGLSMTQMWSWASRQWSGYSAHMQSLVLGTYLPLPGFFEPARYDWVINSNVTTETRGEAVSLFTRPSLYSTAPGELPS